MNIPTATDAKAAAMESRARKQQAALDEQAALIEQRIRERIAEGQCGFHQTGRLDASLKIQLERKGYFCQQVPHPDGAYYTIEWETPRLPRA
jgi:hypothetical protein